MKGLIICMLIINLFFKLSDGFKFFNVLPRANGNASYVDPVIFCDETLGDNKGKCLAVYVVSDPENGIVEQIGLRKSSDGGRNYGTEQFLDETECTDLAVSCGGDFCTVVCRKGSSIIALRSTDLGETFPTKSTIFTDGVTNGVGAPAVSCFIEGTLPKCAVGFRSESQNRFLLLEIPGNTNTPSTFQTFQVPGTDLAIDCLDEELCAIAFGGGLATNVSVTKRALGNFAKFGTPLQIEQSDELSQSSGGAMESGVPTIALAGPDQMVVASANKNSNLLARVEIATSENAGVSFSKFTTMYADAIFDSKNPSASCTGTNCFLTWEVDSLDLFPGFSTSSDGFLSFTEPQDFESLLSNNETTVDMYSNMQTACSYDFCITLVQGQNFLRTVEETAGSVIITFVEVRRPPPEEESPLGLILVSVAGGVLLIVMAAALTVIYRHRKGKLSKIGGSGKSKVTAKPTKAYKGDGGSKASHYNENSYYENSQIYGSQMSQNQDLYSQAGSSSTGTGTTTTSKSSFNPFRINALRKNNVDDSVSNFTDTQSHFTDDDNSSTTSFNNSDFYRASSYPPV